MATEEDTKNQISQHLAQTLPRLMTKYAADANKIAEILVLPQLINLSAYTDLRMPKVCTSVLLVRISTVANTSQ